MTEMKRKASPVARVKRGKGKTVNHPQAASPAVNDRAKANQKSEGMRSVEFLGVGRSADGDRFLKRRVGSHVDLISVAKLISNPPEEYVRLQRAGLPLLRRPARDKFIEQAEIEAGKEPTFLVARQPGLYRGRVCLPGDAVSKGHRTLNSILMSGTPRSMRSFSAPAPMKDGKS
jgi:hypothetical protein